MLTGSTTEVLGIQEALQALGSRLFKGMQMLDPAGVLDQTIFRLPILREIRIEEFHSADQLLQVDQAY